MVAYVLLESGMLNMAETTKLRNQLLRYCELDTMAMVMVWEILLGICGLSRSSR